MTAEKIKRKLTAILSADVKGYSRLMGADEVGTIRILQTYRGVISDLIQKKGGRVVDSPGDNMLAEFASVVDALESAVEIQRELKVRNADRSESRRMEFRMGINLGDVVEEGERIYGDGVNIAARIEGLAEGGGICISGTAFDQIGKRLALGYESLGEQAVKNIEKPVRVYRVLMEPEQAGKVIGERKGKGRRWRWAAVAVGIILVGGALILWNFYFRPSPIEPASKEKMAFPLPDKPSIAVLAFTNMSVDPKDDLLGDGLAEGIINGLSKSEHLLVIARNSTFTYKGKPVKVKQVAEEMGVRYVIEGRVQREGERVRITVQLVDALAGHHLFSERYDRDLKDILDLQDEITMKVVTAVQVKLTAGEGARILEKGTKNLDAFLKVLEAREYKGGTFNKERVERAMQLLEEAIFLDPQYSFAYSVLSTAHFDLVVLGASNSPKESLQRAVELGKKAVTLDEYSPLAHANLAFPYMYLRQFDKAIEEAEKGVSLGPNSAGAYFALGAVLNTLGRHQEAIPVLQKSLRLSPLPVHSQVLGSLGSSYSLTGQYEEAVAIFKKQLQLYGADHLHAHIGLAASYVFMGREKEARSEGAEILRIDPKFTLERFMKGYPRDQATKDGLTEALRKAGLPDKPPLPLPDKPSIVVLPFVNMSEDKSQEFFSDGLTEEIITALSKTPKLFVIARNSTFVYKGKPVNVQQVSRELGVKYVLEGSVRRSGDQLRITAQLIDATTGNHLWAERYDREMKEIFAIQDEITMKVLMAMQVKLVEGEQAVVRAKGTKTLVAYERFLQATEYHYRFTREAGAMAKQLCEEAIAKDSSYAAAYSLLSVVLLAEVRYGWTKTSAETLQRAVEMAQKALALDSENLIAQLAMGQIHLLKKDHDQAIAWGERAVGTHPNADNASAFLAWFLSVSGRSEEAIPLLKNAMRRNPMPPSWYHVLLGNAYRLLGRFEEAATELRTAVGRSPDDMLAHMVLTATYAQAGREEEARTQAAEVLRIQPTFSLDYYEKTSTNKNKADTDRYIEALRKAGLK